ncbi:MAG: cyclic nucleotide-binding domain-containing protein [Methylophilaceae bacterium]|nr:cyclic nucleotide-binding domain-containing protein [Methyloradius sp.]
MASIESSIIAQLQPISTLSPGRLKELAGLCFVEKVSKDINPFRMNVSKAAQALYLLSGELGLRYANGNKKIMRGGSEASRHAVDASAGLVEAIALTEIEIVRIDLDLLDIMMTWDQLSDFEKPSTNEAQKSDTTKTSDNAGHSLAKPARAATSWMGDTGVFSASKLQTGVFSRLPSANIEEMFNRMTSIDVKAGQVIIHQGAEGDYYYLIENGTAVVSRVTEATQPPTILAELHAGDAFGEEALVSDNKRNATITIKTEGVLLRLKKTDFIELLKAPLISQINMEEARKLAANGSIWVDVRFPSEYQFDHLSKAINIPLNELRSLIPTLDKQKEYIVYCQTGRRSSAAAFVLVEQGFRVQVLEGGTRGSKV